MVEKSTRRSGLDIRHYPKDPGASPESLAKLSGFIKLNGPTPSHKSLETDGKDETEQANSSAGN